MIIVQVVGGLANQMSGYAAARSLAAQLNVPLKIDVGDLARDTVRSLELDKLHTQLEIATPAEVRAVSGQSRWRFVNRWRKSFYRKRGQQMPHLYREHSLHFDPNFFKLDNDAYLVGNYMSVHYYQPVLDRLREEFTIRLPLSVESERWQQVIRSTPSAVALHVRRSDYAHNPKVTAAHGLLPISYYERAVQAMLQRVPSAQFFVFSDDPAWVREHVRVAAPVHYVDCNDIANGYQDYHLMKQCHHYVIANSGFSRWAALLNSRADKIVMMPQQWMVNCSMHDDDVAPLDWQRIDHLV